jgi:hypothetical protein
MAATCVQATHDAYARRRNTDPNMQRIGRLVGHRRPCCGLNLHINFTKITKRNTFSFPFPQAREGCDICTKQGQSTQNSPSQALGNWYLQVTNNQSTPNKPRYTNARYGTARYMVKLKNSFVQISQQKKKKKIFLRRNVNNKSTRHNQMVPESELKTHL